jgi:hypothetical protein
MMGWAGLPKLLVKRLRYSSALGVPRVSARLMRALSVAGKRYISATSINTELENAVGRVVRAFDPCIACATQ